MKKNYYICNVLVELAQKIKRRTKLWQRLSDPSQFSPVKRQNALSGWLMLPKRILTPRKAASQRRTSRRFSQRPSSNRMGFLADSCTMKILTRDVLSTCKNFYCGDADLDEFFSEDAPLHHDAMLGKSYGYLDRKTGRQRGFCRQRGWLRAAFPHQVAVNFARQSF